MNNVITYYDINPSQEVVRLQCKYTLFKRVMNILTSATSDKPINWEIMKQAFNKTIERNDCLRLKFVKKDKKLMQYFQDEVKVNEIPYIEFKTKEEQEKFFLETRKVPVKYLDNQIFEIHFCKTYDNKSMFIFKVCHLIFDIFGLNNFYKDLFGVYESLITNTDLPPCPTKFEDVIKKDLAYKNNADITKRNTDFFENYFASHDCPDYVGLHGPNQPIWKKLLKKHKHSMKMFFIKNDTQSYMLPIDKSITTKALEFCKEKSCSISNFFFYTMSLTASIMNGNVKNMIPLELVNCRATLTEKKCAGTKVQSIGSYTSVDFDKSFNENLNFFSVEQNNLYRYIGFSDIAFQNMLHKFYHHSLISTFYSITFSFIPYEKVEGIDIQIYSNGKCALPAYIALMWDIKSNNINVAYDVQTKIISENDVNTFHKNYVYMLEKVLENPEIIVKDIKL